MSISDGLLFMLQRAKLRLCWVRGKQLWTAETSREYILVDHEIYHRALKEELAKRGIEMKTWSEYMKPAQDAWSQQCAIEDQLKSDFDFWKQVQGVKISPLNSEVQKENI